MFVHTMFVGVLVEVFKRSYRQQTIARKQKLQAVLGGVDSFVVVVAFLEYLDCVQGQ